MGKSMDEQPPEDYGEGSGASRIPSISPCSCQLTHLHNLPRNGGLRKDNICAGNI